MNQQVNDLMTKDEIRETVKKGVEEGLKDALTSLGIDHERPLEMQADFQYLRKLRSGRDALTSKTALFIFGAILTAAGTMLAIGFQTLFGRT